MQNRKFLMWCMPPHCGHSRWIAYQRHPSSQTKKPRKLPQHVMKCCKLPTSQAASSHPRAIGGENRALVFVFWSTSALCLIFHPQKESDKNTNNSWLAFCCCKYLMQKCSANTINLLVKNCSRTSQTSFSNKLYTSRSQVPSRIYLFIIISLIISKTLNFLLKWPNSSTIVLLQLQFLSFVFQQWLTLSHQSASLICFQPLWPHVDQVSFWHKHHHFFD